ncbi:MAG TPA: AcvB/VirJ family lysyl-phosphatidylglycerol hydrolase [Chitinophagaceae bacterium]|nr:AcvB/VirJ family lysyl-phosphatidylglycerol hydrolase [Chitinophagaceae bacterium]
MRPIPDLPVIIKRMVYFLLWMSCIPDCPAMALPGMVKGVQQPAGPGNLPIIVTPSLVNPSMPMVLLLTGDGGYRGLEQNLAASFARQGSPVVALNSLHYFWNKKTPANTTAAVSVLLDYYLKRWHRENLVLVGYSFGADVLPFIVNRLDEELRSRISLIVLMSPGPSVDFEIHISQMLENRGNWEYPVPPEINQIRGKPLLCIFGKKEKEYPMNELPRSDTRVIYLDGGHHYGPNKQDIARLILDDLPAGLPQKPSPERFPHSGNR